MDELARSAVFREAAEASFRASAQVLIAISPDKETKALIYRIIGDCIFDATPAVSTEPARAPVSEQKTGSPPPTTPARKEKRKAKGEETRPISRGATSGKGDDETPASKRKKRGVVRPIIDDQSGSSEEDIPAAKRSSSKRSSGFSPIPKLTLPQKAAAPQPAVVNPSTKPPAKTPGSSTSKFAMLDLPPPKTLRELLLEGTPSKPGSTPEEKAAVKKPVKKTVEKPVEKATGVHKTPEADRSMGSTSAKGKEKASKSELSLSAKIHAIGPNW